MVLDKTDWQKESLKSDFVTYFNDFLVDLKEVAPKWEPPEYVKMIAWDQYKILKETNIDEWDLENQDENILEFWFKNYLKDWEYKRVFWEAKIKLLSYFDAIKNCIKNYWDEKYYSNLRKERKLLNEYIEENLKTLKEGFIDFMISITYPNLSVHDRKYLIYETVDRTNIETYLPLIRKLFDKIDKRLIWE